MAPTKRKGNVSEEATARQSQKRAKVDAEVHKKEQRPHDTALAASELSVLRDDEPSFPRGGGSVLTPVERRQIQIQATKDVLFEQRGPKKTTRQSENSDLDDEYDVEMRDADTTASTKKSRKKNTNGKKSMDKERSEKRGVRIESLSFKVWGSMLEKGYRKFRLTLAAHRSWLHDTRTSIERQFPRYRPFPTE